MSGEELKINLTEAQKKAISVDPSTDRIVIAMAGSGKTTVLVEYYYALLMMENGYSPSEIVAITFTEKAAREMRIKLIRKLSKEGKDIEARGLYSAPISTIHSFCANLVRENSLVLGLDPDWNVLDETKSSMMMEECLKNSMRRLKEERSDLYDVLMRQIDWQGDPYSTFMDFYNDFRSRGFTIEQLSSGPNVNDVLRKAKSDFLDTIDAFISAVNSKNSDKGASESEIRKRDALKTVYELVGSMDIVDCTPEKIAQIEEILKSGNISTNVSSVLMDYLKAVRESKSTFIDKLVYIMADDVRKAFVESVRFFEQEYRNAKNDESALDFDDLQDLAIKLIKEFPHVRERIKSRIKAILIDEFQDTNPVQMALVELVRPENRFFAVGDPRQSIYGFRHTDVSIMLDEIEKYKDGKGEVVELNENFRSRGAILDVVSEFFMNVPIDPDYKDMCFGAMKSGRNFIHEGSSNPVEIMISASEAVDDAREIEAKAVANKVAEILNSGMMIEEKGGIVRKAEPSDIALLFRVSTNMTIYSRALENVKIPHHVFSAHGFYSQREVMDLINFLELLLEPNDVLHLSEVLRAPFCGISIDGLYKIVSSLKTYKHRGFLLCGEPFWELNVISLGEDDFNRWNNFKEMFPKLLEKCQSLGPSGRLREVLSFTHFRGASALGAGGKRRLGNIGKLLDFASVWEMDFPADNRGFVERMKTLRFRKAREGETPVSAVENSVSMMTVHSAKGLEFPIVIFVDASSRGKGDDFPVILNDSGEVFIQRRFAKDELPPKAKDYFYQGEKEQKKKFFDNELKRVLYVALTRAMEKLIISFALGEKSYGTAFDFFNERLKLEELKNSAGTRLTIGSALVPVISGWVMAGKPLYYSASSKDESIFEIEKEIERLEKGLPKIPNLDTVYSVTSLSAWTICPRRMNYRYIHGYGLLEKEIKPLTDQLKVLDDEEDEEFKGGGYDEFPILERGTLIHGMLCELVAKGDNFDMESFLAKEGKVGDETLKSDLNKVAEKFKKSDIGKSLIAADKKYLESSFVFKIEGYDVLFKAVVDAIWVKDGKWHLVDYKSGRAHEFDDKVGKAYEEQVRMYVRAINATFNVDVEKASILYIDEEVEREVDISPKAMEGNYNLIGRFLESIINDDFPPNSSGECNYCSFRKGCSGVPLNSF